MANCTHSRSVFSARAAVMWLANRSPGRGRFVLRDSHGCAYSGTLGITKLFHIWSRGAKVIRLLHGLGCVTRALVLYTGLKLLR